MVRNELIIDNSCSDCGCRNSNYFESELSVSVAEEGDGVGEDPLAPLVADEFRPRPESVATGSDVRGHAFLDVAGHARAHLSGL